MFFVQFIFQKIELNFSLDCLLRIHCQSLSRITIFFNYIWDLRSLQYLIGTEASLDSFTTRTCTPLQTAEFMVTLLILGVVPLLPLFTVSKP